MEAFKNFFQTVDIFGITYAFRYKGKEKYQTAFGGFIVILFLILVLVMGIYYFIPFINRKNYTIVYYTMNLAATEEVNLFASESNFAFGLICEANKNEKYDIYDLLNLKTRYVLYIKSRDGTYKKDAKVLETHLCTYEDFYNKYDAQFDYLNLDTYVCVANKEDTIQGIYADQVFSYFEYSVVAKNDSRELTYEIERFLFENDCKLQLAFTDIIIDLDNYKEPITQYLNTIFIQLNPVLFIKRNIYFMNQHFSNDDFLMFVFGDDQEPERKTLFSRYEEYALYKGLNRFQTQPEEYDYYSKVYIRADLKKTVIKRKYQKFMEFYADASSLLVAIYEILVVIFNYVDTFYAHHSLAKTIFFFKELEDKDNFNISKKRAALQDLIAITESQKKNMENEDKEIQSKSSKMMKNFPPKKKEQVNDNKEENNKEIKIYNSRNSPIDKKNTNTKSSSYIKGKEMFNKKDYNRNYKDNFNEKYDDDFNKADYDDSYPRYKINQLKRNISSNVMMNLRNSNKNDFFSESFGTNMEDFSSESDASKRPKKRNIKVENNFNIFEIIISQFFCCCMCKNIAIKNYANEKANEIMFKKMDIITYVRNMILFDILNQTMLDSGKKAIINFLGRPIISINQKRKNKFDEFYKNYREKDFNKYYDLMKELTENPDKEEREEKLIQISNEHLKAFM